MLSFKKAFFLITLSFLRAGYGVSSDQIEIFAKEELERIKNLPFQVDVCMGRLDGQLDKIVYSYLKETKGAITLHELVAQFQLTSEDVLSPSSQRQTPREYLKKLISQRSFLASKQKPLFLIADISDHLKKTLYLDAADCQQYGFLS